MQLRHGGFKVAEQQGLSNLQLEPMRCEACFFQRRANDVADASRRELRGREVDRNGQVLRPSGGGATRLPQHPCADFVDEPQLLGNGNQHQRRNKCSVFGRQAYERLEVEETVL